MYFKEVDLLIQELALQSYEIKLLSLLPPSFKQQGQYCKLLSLCSALQWSYQQGPEQFNSPPYPTKNDIRNHHLPQQVNRFKSLREQAKKLHSQVGELYDVRKLIHLANSNGYTNVYYKHYESLDIYQQDLIAAIDQETMVNVFYDVNVKDGTPIKNQSYSEHSGLVVGYALKDNEPPLAIVSTHNQYIALKIHDLFESSIQLQAIRKPETFFKDSNKFWRNVDETIKLTNPNIKIRKALPPEKDAVSFRGKMIFYSSNSKNDNVYLNEELMQFSDQPIAHYSLESFKDDLPSDYIPLEILVHFLETLHILGKNKNREMFERFAREFDFKNEIIQLCLDENETQVSGALMDDIFKQNRETKRSIVEITSNALDAKPTLVLVNIVDGEYSVIDDGIGMTAFEILNHLLVSKISSKNGLVDVIGRFGIGFYTSLAHLKNENSSVTVKTHSRQEEYGYIIHFRWHQARMEVRIQADKNLPFGTAVIVQADEIKKADYEPYVKKHFPFVENAQLIINDNKIEFDKAYQALPTKQGTLLFKTEEDKVKGSLTIVIANVFITDYFYEESNSNLSIVWKFPNQTSITEGRNAIQVDNQSIINNIKEFINAVHDLPQNLQIKYLNTISSGVLHMQEHNALKSPSNNLRQYLFDVLTKITTNKKCIPDESAYLFLANDDVVNVSRNILADNWEEQVGYRIGEWRSEKNSAYAINMNGKKNIFFDPYHYVAFFSFDFLNHVRKNNLFDYLPNLVEILKLTGEFSQAETPTEIIAHKVNTYINYQFDPHHELYNHHGGLSKVDTTLLDQISADDQLVLRDAPTLVARHPFRGPLKGSYEKYQFDTTNWMGVSYQNGGYANRDYFIRYYHGHHWETLVYDQNFQVISGDKGAFLAAYFRNTHHIKNGEHDIVDLKRLIVRKSEEISQLIDIETKNILIDNLPLHSYYIPIPDSELYCIKTVPIDKQKFEKMSYKGENTIYEGSRKISHIDGDIRILPWNGHYLVFSEFGNAGFLKHYFKVYLYTKEFKCLDSIYLDCWPLYGKIHCETYQHENEQLLMIHSHQHILPLLFNPETKRLKSLAQSHLIGQNAIEIGKQLYTFTIDKTTMLLGKIRSIFNIDSYASINDDEKRQSRAVIYIDDTENERIYGADGKISLLPQSIEQKQIVSYSHNKSFQCIKLKEGYIYKNNHDWVFAENVQLAQSSDDSFALIDHTEIINSKNDVIYISQDPKIKIDARIDCPYLLIKGIKDKYWPLNNIIDSKGRPIVTDKISDIEFVKDKTDWTITFYNCIEERIRKRTIVNKHGIIEQEITQARQIFQADNDGFVWYPIRQTTPELITNNAYYVCEDKDYNYSTKTSFKTPPYFYKLINSALLLDPEVIKNIDFLNKNTLRVSDYSNCLRFIDCDHSIFIAFYGYFSIFKYAPTREQFRDYYQVYQAISLINPSYLNTGLRLMDLIHYCAGNHSEMVLTNKLAEIIKFYGVSILRDLYEVYSEDTQLLYYQLHDNKPLHNIFSRLSNKLREISYFIFSNKTNLLTQNGYEPLFDNTYEHKKTSILGLITSVSLRKNMVKNATDIESIMDLANTMSAGLDTSFALRGLKHAIYNLSDSSQPIYLREFLQNALDASTMGMTIDVEFFNQQNFHVSRIADSGQGMTLLDLFAYLIIPGNSTKRNLSEFIGGRGVGFFSAFNGAKEIIVKTSTGDGITQYMNFEPCYDENDKIFDISISAYQKKEAFNGTIVDRISSDENAALEAARCLSAIRQYGSFIDAKKVKIIVNQAQINKNLMYLGELQFAKIGACKIYSNSECAFTAGGLYIKKIDDFYWNNLPGFMMQALKHNGILIDLPSKIALVRERNDFQNADKFIEFFKPLFFQLCLNAYCVLLKNGKISDDYLPYDLFDHLTPGLHSLANLESIKDDIIAINEGKLIAYSKKYLNRDHCIKLLVNINFISYGYNKISIATIGNLHRNSNLRLDKLPDFITSRLKRQESSIIQQKTFNEIFKENMNIYEEQLAKYKHCSWSLPENAFENADNWRVFYKLCQDISVCIAAQYALKIDIHFSTVHPTALAYVSPRDFYMTSENDSPVKHSIIYINPFNWESFLNNAFHNYDHDTLIIQLIFVISHEIAHIIENSGCAGGTRAFTHDHDFNEVHAQIYTNMLMQLDIKQLTISLKKEIRELKSINEKQAKYPNAKELMIIQLLGKKDYLEFLLEEKQGLQSKKTMSPKC